MPLLNPSLKLTAKSLLVNKGNLQSWMVWLTRGYQVAWRFGRVPKDWQIDRPHTKKWRQEWINQLPRHIFAKPPRKSVCQDAAKIIEPNCHSTANFRVILGACQERLHVFRHGHRRGCRECILPTRPKDVLT